MTRSEIEAEARLFGLQGLLAARRADLLSAALAKTAVVPDAQLAVVRSLRAIADHAYEAAASVRRRAKELP